METIERGPDAVDVDLLGVGSAADSQHCCGAERRNGEGKEAASMHDRSRIGANAESLYGIMARRQRSLSPRAPIAGCGSWPPAG